VEGSVRAHAARTKDVRSRGHPLKLVMGTIVHAHAAQTRVFAAEGTSKRWWAPLRMRIEDHAKSRARAWPSRCACACAQATVYDKQSRGARLAVACVDCRAALQQRRNDGALHVEHGAVQRRRACRVARLDVQALVQQPGHLGRSRSRERMIWGLCNAARAGCLCAASALFTRRASHYERHLTRSGVGDSA
jgi:hypothetical protein